MMSNLRRESIYWQSEMGLHDRNWNMLQNELKTDVTFKVSSVPDDDIPSWENVAFIRAHRYMLISASPVFWAMFCGELRERGSVTVTDVTPEAFWEMLRFIYTERVIIGNDNVMQIWHAAKKYQLSNLVETCVYYLKINLKATNACSILHHSEFFGEKGLSKICMEFIEEYTEEALASDGFMNISSEALGVILDNSQLAIAEVTLFEKVFEWASRRSSNTLSVREVLGENFYKIRFPTMKIDDFTEKICSKNLLTENEQLQIFKHISSPTTNDSPFRCEARKGITSTSQENEQNVDIGDRVRVRGPGLRFTSCLCFFCPTYVPSNVEGVVMERAIWRDEYIVRLIESGSKAILHRCELERFS